MVSVTMSGVKRKEPENVLIGFRVTQRMKDDIDQYATSAGVSCAAWLRDAVNEKMARENEDVSGERTMTWILDDPYLQDKIVDLLGDRLRPTIEASIRRVLDEGWRGGRVE